MNGDATPSPMDHPIYLIVNADDYGYFPCVSRGILAAARTGVVTATGVFANSPYLEQHVSWLRFSPDLDLGVHLCLTSGTPISNVMKRRLRWFGGRFPRKELMSGALLTAAVTIADVREEWERQIETCLARGLRLMFVNSHEHIHMWPSLYPLIHELARDYAIQHVRSPHGEVPRQQTARALSRNLIINVLRRLNGRRASIGGIPCLGVGESGNLSFDYLQHLVGKLGRGGIYELMCHPGYFEPDEVKDHSLRRYHNWEGELKVLTSEATAELFANHGVRPIGYRELPISQDLPKEKDAGGQ
jgi:chitin disaccharide deacetylase